MTALLLRAEDFVRELQDLGPSWDGIWSLERYLKAFDESGGLRPVFRVHLPARYADYDADRRGVVLETPLEASEVAELERFDDMLGELRTRPSDPETASPFERPRPEMADMIHRADAAQGVRWSDWERIVGHHNGQPVLRPFVFSFYGQWQRLRFWALLEAYTFRALMDPRKLQPQQIFDPDWDRDTRAQLLTTTVGNPRILGLVASLEAHDWLRVLYLVREVIEWGELRVQDPRLTRWVDGEAMTIEDRAALETVRVRNRCQVLGDAWLADRAAFLSRLRSVIELWSHAAEASAVRFSTVVEEDLRAAVRWAGFMYGDEFGVLDRELGPDLRWRRTLGSVLRPTWTAARSGADKYVPDFVESLAREAGVLNLGRQDSAGFLDFLNEQGLSAWYLEFAGLVSELQRPSDTSWDRRFLHIRSMANLVEPVLVALADRLGTPADQARMKGGNLRDPLKVFLADRTADWRARLWQIVADHWELTQTVDFTLPQRLDAIATSSWGPDLTGMARTILAFAALRNFGSHRFTRDPEVLSAYQGRLFSAVVWTPLLYWKIATSLG